MSCTCSTSLTDNVLCMLRSLLCNCDAKLYVCVNVSHSPPPTPTHSSLHFPSLPPFLPPSYLPSLSLFLALFPFILPPSFPSALCSLLEQHFSEAVGIETGLTMTALERPCDDKKEVKDALPPLQNSPSQNSPSPRLRRSAKSSTIGRSKSVTIS